MLDFEIPLPQSTVTKLSFSDKELLRTLVLEMHEEGMSYREIGRALGLHWTRVHQIVKRP
jgi:DNA-directed RNA polymerase specialized sigma24 family protein